MTTTFRPTADTALPRNADRAIAYFGPDRRSTASAVGDWLSAALDELDYGVLLVTQDAEVLYRNHATIGEFEARHPLVCDGRQLRARKPADAMALRDALHSACQKQTRKLVTLGDGDDRVAVSVVPLAREGSGGAPGPTLLVLGKRRVCEDLSAQGYARSHGLTGAETRVLCGLCAGSTPSRIALDLGIAISTVRTHIGTIRVKTGAASIRSLVGQVAQLPPLRGALRQAVTRSGPAAVRPGDGWPSWVAYPRAA